jgi:hypothetical protein
LGHHRHHRLSRPEGEVEREGIKTGADHRYDLPTQAQNGTGKDPSGICRGPHHKQRSGRVKKDVLAIGPFPPSGTQREVDLSALFGHSSLLHVP